MEHYCLIVDPSIVASRMSSATNSSYSHQFLLSLSPLFYFSFVSSFQFLLVLQKIYLFFIKNSFWDFKLKKTQNWFDFFRCPLQTRFCFKVCQILKKQWNVYTASDRFVFLKEQNWGETCLSTVQIVPIKFLPNVSNLLLGFLLLRSFPRSLISK